MKLKRSLCSVKSGDKVKPDVLNRGKNCWISIDKTFGHRLTEGTEAGDSQVVMIEVVIGRSPGHNGHQNQCNQGSGNGRNNH